MTAPSPPTSGSVATRTSMRRPSTFSAVRPSCGTRRSAMSSSDMILMREMTPATRRRGMRVASASTPSTRKRTTSSPRDGLEVDVGGALVDALRDERVDELDDRRLVGGLAEVDDLRPLVGDGLLDDHVVDLVHAPDERADVLLRRDGGADLVAGHQRDVVDREHVARVDHRDEQRALVEEADGDGGVALRGRGGQQVGRGHVDAEGVEVDVVDAEALGDDPGELVRGQDAAVDEDLARAPAAGPRLGDRELHGLPSGVAEADDDVADLLRRAAARGRRRETGRGRGVRAGERATCPGYRQEQAEPVALPRRVERLVDERVGVRVLRARHRAHAPARRSAPAPPAPPRAAASCPGA